MKMTKSLCVIFLFIALIAFSGCSKKELNYTITEADGIKTYHNKNIPADEKLEIKIKELFTIDSEDEKLNDSSRTINSIYTIHVDYDGNIYVLDNTRSNIKKFDKNGKFIKSIGRKGQGPGEFGFCITAEIMNEEIVCNDYDAQKLVVFDKDGNFKRNMIMDKGVPQIYEMLNNKKILSNFNFWEVIEDEVYTTTTIILCDSIFENRNDTLRYVRMKTLRNSEEDYRFNFWGRAVKDDRIYLSRNDINEYLIDVYDLNGNLLHTISKSYIKVKYTPKEIEGINKFIKDYSGDPEAPNTKLVYKKSISDLRVDKYDRLWVDSSLAPKKEAENEEFRGYSFDIFKDGVYQNRINIGFPEGYYPAIFRNGKIYAYNKDLSSIKVFDY